MASGAELKQAVNGSGSRLKEAIKEPSALGEFTGHFGREVVGTLADASKMMLTNADILLPGTPVEEGFKSVGIPLGKDDVVSKFSFLPQDDPTTLSGRS